MTDEQRKYALDVMQRMPRNLRRTYREANALVGMLDPLCSDEPKNPDDTSITISRAMLHSICTLAEGVRDALSVSAQQARSIADLMSLPDAWETSNGEHNDDSSGIH